MCMLIHHPANATPFSRAEIKDFNVRNPHGFGAMWRTPSGEIHARKGMISPDRQWQLYQSLLANGCSEMALHWRYATAGRVCVDNCHPIEVRDDALVMHNGARIGPSTAEESDSVVFAHNVLARCLPKVGGATRHPKFVKALEDRIGGGNRLIIWHRDNPKPVVIGEAQGLWHRGRWYSNTYAWSVPNDAMKPAPRVMNGGRNWQTIDRFWAR